MNEKEEPMNMNVTPPVEPVTEFEVPLPPDRKRPKWLVPLIAGSTAVVVLAAVGTGGYLYWNHNQLTAASEECATSYDKAVKAQKKLTEYLKSDALQTAIKVKDSEVKDAKTVGTLASTVKAAEKTKTTVPECPSGNRADIEAMTKEIDGLATAYAKTVNLVRGKADAVNDSIKAKSDADAKAKAEKAKQTAEDTAQTSGNDSGSAGDTGGGYTGYTGGGYTQSQGGGYTYTPQQSTGGSTGGGYTPTPQPQPQQPSQGGGNGGGSTGGDDGYENMCFAYPTDGSPAIQVPCS